MNFEIWYTTCNLVKVIKNQDGGCGPFEVTFPDMESAQDFIIRVAALNGDLPKEIRDEIL